jgi:putative ABC transport system permease protein
MLLAAAGLFMRSFVRLRQVDPGFDSRNVLTFGLPIPEKRFNEPAALIAYQQQLEARLRALPGVTDVAFTSALPMRGWGYGMPFLLADGPTVDRANRDACFFKMVSPSYFHTLGLTVKRGRPLRESDIRGGAPVTVISESMAKRYFKDKDPLGKRILVQEIVPGKPKLGEEIPWEVVGIVANEKVGGLGDKDEYNPGIYVTTSQSPNFGLAVVLRSAQDPLTLGETVRKAIREISRDQVVDDLKTLDAIKAESLGDSRFRMILLGVFAGVALLLSAIGIYGVISYSVTQRIREIGIRAALGADQSAILRLILGRGLALALLGLVVGAIGAISLTRLMSSLLFGIGDRDPLTLAAVAVLLAVVASFACYLPARRAMRVDPLVALREE